MNLNSISIDNYRSLEKLTLPIEVLPDQSRTFGLLGVNEAGKSSLLRAIALKEGLINQSGEQLPLRKDFRKKSETIKVAYHYELEESEIRQAQSILKNQFPDVTIENDLLRIFIFHAEFDHSTPEIPDYRIVFPDLAQSNLCEMVEESLYEYLKLKTHTPVFWTAESRFLISDPINLTEFAENLDGVSIPLKNSFLLAGINDIPAAISDAMTDPAELHYLSEKLGKSVTKHISKRWPGHPVTITFLITDGKIHFLVNDAKVTGKAKTADQRSDGFRQLVSFLLTISAQSTNNELSNTILVLDEPETHLHPKAQEDLLQELTNITSNDMNNIVLFATHSIFMVDKIQISRNYKVSKLGTSTTAERLEQRAATFASVIYDVFGIESSDYHCELFGALHAKYQNADLQDDHRDRIKNFDDNFLVDEKGLPKDKPWRGNRNSCSLPTYVRNCIHHPDNGNTFTGVELKKSISLLKSYM